MNGWRSRLTIGLLMALLMWAHAYATSSLPNTPLGQLMYHGSAALVDLATLLVLPYWLADRLCDNIETLVLLSLMGNGAGWALYMAYAPPIFYNCFIWGIALASWLRLLYMDRDDANADSMGWNLVRRGHRGSH